MISLANVNKCEQIGSFLRIITFTKDTFFGKLHFLCDVFDQGSSPNFAYNNGDNKRISQPLLPLKSLENF